MKPLPRSRHPFPCARFSAALFFSVLGAFTSCAWATGHEKEPGPDWSQAKAVSASLRNAGGGVPTRPIAPAAMPSALSFSPSASLQAVQLRLPDGTPATFGQYLAENFVEGMVIMHRGRVVYEQYFNGMGATDTHGWASMAKSVVGVLAVQLASEHKIDLNAELGRYVPELQNTPFGKATVQQNMDMQVALAYQPGVPPDVGLFTAVGLLPKREGMPGTILEYLNTVRPAQEPHGGVFYYQNGSTEAVALALTRVTGQPLAELVSERLWRPMGAEKPAHYVVDATGAAFAAGGITSTLRDAARFAELIRTKGRIADRQVLAPAAVERVLATPSAENQQLLARAGRAGAGGTGYANFWWHPLRTPGVVLALGRYGQRIYIDPQNELTITQFGAYPDNRPRATAIGQRSAAHESALRTDDGFIALAQAVLARLQP